MLNSFFLSTERVPRQEGNAKKGGNSTGKKVKDGVCPICGAVLPLSILEAHVSLNHFDTGADTVVEELTAKRSRLDIQIVYDPPSPEPRSLTTYRPFDARLAVLVTTWQLRGAGRETNGSGQIMRTLTIHGE